MKFKIKCNRDLTLLLDYYGKSYSCVQGEIYDAFFDNDGIRFLINGCYTLPYNVYTVNEYFDALYYEKTYKEIKEDEIIITRKDYNIMCKAYKKLTVLEEVGVDNWSGYGYALCLLDDYEDNE